MRFCPGADPHANNPLKCDGCGGFTDALRIFNPAGGRADEAELLCHACADAKEAPPAGDPAGGDWGAAKVTIWSGGKEKP